MKEVAVVILNWNGQELLEKFLPSVTKFSQEARIIIADNASSDTSIAFIKENYPSVEIVVNFENGGFAKGYNDALKKIDSKYYLLLNSDVEVSKDWLAPLLEKMKDENVAACQPKIIDFKNKEKFEHAGACGGFIDKNYFPFCRGRIFENVERDSGQYNNSMEVFWVSGAAMLVRSEVFHQVGGFDETFFAHMEEIDLCWRIKRLNYQLFVVPQSVVYHVGGATLSYSSPRKIHLNFRNNLVMMYKNHEGILLGKVLWRKTLDGVAAMRFLMKGEFRAFWAVFRAHIYIYGNLRAILRERKSLKFSSKTFNRAGLFKGSIIWNHYGKKVNHFNELDQDLFVK